MLTRKNTISLLTATLFVSVSLSANAETPLGEAVGSEAPRIVAEVTHNARVHGIPSMPERPQAQAQGSVKAQATAEEIHLKKEHGNINDAADQRMLREASRL